MIVAGYDNTGNRVSFDNYVDRVYELEFGTGRRTAPEDYNKKRPVKIISELCLYIEVYIYIVVNTFPDSEMIKDSPPFKATLKVTPQGGKPEERSYEVNQWGGMTVTAEKFIAIK